MVPGQGRPEVGCLGTHPPHSPRRLPCPCRWTAIGQLGKQSLSRRCWPAQRPAEVGSPDSQSVLGLVGSDRPRRRCTLWRLVYWHGDQQDRLCRWPWDQRQLARRTQPGTVHRFGYLCHTSLLDMVHSVGHSSQSPLGKGNTRPWYCLSRGAARCCGGQPVLLGKPRRKKHPCLNRNPVGRAGSRRTLHRPCRCLAHRLCTPPGGQRSPASTGWPVSRAEASAVPNVPAKAWTRATASGRRAVNQKVFLFLCVCGRVAVGEGGGREWACPGQPDKAQCVGAQGLDWGGGWCWGWVRVWVCRIMCNPVARISKNGAF